MGILYQQFSSNVGILAMLKLYTSLERSHLEYGIEVWNPYLQKDIVALECTNICSKSLLNWSSTNKDLLDLSKLQSLQNRQSFQSLNTLFKIIHTIVYFPPDLLPPLLSLSRLRSGVCVNPLSPNDAIWRHTYFRHHNFMKKFQNIPKLSQIKEYK